MDKNGLIVVLLLLFLIYIYPAVGMFKYRKEPWPQQHKFLWVLVGIGLFQLLAVMSVILIMAFRGHEFHWAVLFGMVFVSCALMSISYIPFYRVGLAYRLKEQMKEYTESHRHDEIAEEQSEETSDNDGYTLKVYDNESIRKFIEKPST